MFLSTLASSELLALFSAHHTGCTSNKTLNNWLASLHFWHTVNGAPWNGNSMLHHVCRGFSKLVPPSSRHAKCPPVTLEALLCIPHDNLNSLIPLILLFGPLLPSLSGAVAGQFGFSFPSPLLIFPWFLQCCNQVWVSAGFPVMPGHAFCIGGTTELLLQGVPPDIVTT